MKQELNSGAEAAAGVEAAEKGAGDGDGDVNAATQGTASKASANVVRARVTGGGKGTGSLADRIPEGESSWYI
jgi:hypothetical protein